MVRKVVPKVSPDKKFSTSEKGDKRNTTEKKGQTDTKAEEAKSISIEEARKIELSNFGFSFKRSGAHVCRTMMLSELEILLEAVENVNATKEEYKKAVIDKNILGKRSLSNRILSYRHLVSLYSLNPSILLFRTLRFFWDRDKEGRPLLALLCAYARDSVLRLSAEYALGLEKGETVSRDETEKIIDDKEPGRFSKVTVESVARHVNSTWTKAGIFKGVVVKKRSSPKATIGSLSYALFLGYLCGMRGKIIFESEYVKLLDISYDIALNLAFEASGKDWINFKMIGNVVDLSFAKFLYE
jgi:hypothetical protein